MLNPSVSVIVGFKNWGVDRLDKCLASLRGSTYPGTLQIVISDYGSDDQQSVTAVARKWGADYLTSEPINGWSRAGAINAGLSAAMGEVLIATDVDMIFLPTTITAVVEALKESAHDTVIIQCRDLPRGFSHDDIDLSAIDWVEIGEVAQLRPRWGMGGFVAQARETALRIRGLDERLHTYGGEDIDYATRCRRSGSRITWLDDERARIYHMWHEPTMRHAKLDAKFKKAIEDNRRTYQTDSTILRNLEGWEYATSVAYPAMSFILSDVRGDSAENFQNQLECVLSQQGVPLEAVVATSRTHLPFEPAGEPIRVMAMDCHEVRWRRTELVEAVEFARGMYVLVDDAPAFIGRTRGREMLGECHGGVSVVKAGSMRASADEGFERSPMEFGDLLFERRSLIAGLRTFPDEYVSAAKLLEHMVRNGFRVRESTSMQRLVPDPAGVGAGEQPSWIGAIAESATPEQTKLEPGASISALEIMSDISAQYTLAMASVHGDLEDAALLSSDILARPEVSGVMSDPAGGSAYCLRAYSGLGYAVARRAVRRAAQNGVLVQTYIDKGAARSVLDVGAAVLSSVYGASVADHNWILAEIPGASDEPPAAALAAAGSAMTAANALLRELALDEQRMTMLLLGPFESSSATSAMLELVGRLPDAAAVRLLGPVPEGVFGGDSK